MALKIQNGKLNKWEKSVWINNKSDTRSGYRVDY